MENETILKPTKKEMWTIGIAMFSLLLFEIVITINIFRQELFGVIPGNAAENFAFNFSFFLPANLIIFILSSGMFIRTFKNWKVWRSLKRKLLIFGLTLPVISLWIIQIIRIVYMD